MQFCSKMFKGTFKLLDTDKERYSNIRNNIISNLNPSNLVKFIKTIKNFFIDLLSETFTESEIDDFMMKDSNFEEFSRHGDLNKLLETLESTKRNNMKPDIQLNIKPKIVYLN